MNTMLKISVLAIFFLSLNSAYSDQSPPSFKPAEVYGCKWLPGKGMADLDKVVKKFEVYTDKNNSSYNAWVLTPQFFNSSTMHDVMWLGSWEDGEAFGLGMESWNSSGTALAAEFAKVVDCSNRHELLRSVAVNAPDGNPGDAVLLTAKCSLKKGKSREDAYAAHLKSGQAMKAMGALTMSWLFYPTLGAGDIDFDYWHVIGFTRYSDLGVTLDMYLGEKGGIQKAEAIIGAVATCATPTVSNARMIYESKVAQ